MLDDVDLTLFEALGRDGRATFQSLADLIGLSRTATRSRLRALQDAGMVRIVSAVHPDIRGLGVTAQLLVQVEYEMDGVATAIANRPSVCYAVVCAGPFDLQIAVRAGDDDALAAEADRIRGIEGVRTAQVLRVVQTLCDVPAPPGPLGQVALDELDWRLLKELQRNGRASYASLAHIVGLSSAATRIRVRHLFDAKAIRVTAMADPRVTGLTTRGGFGLMVGGPVWQVAQRVASRLGVWYLATGYGPYDIIGHAAADSGRHLAEVLAAIQATPGVIGHTCWHHLDVLTTADLPPVGTSPAARWGQR